jgi:hypothetical protein
LIFKVLAGRQKLNYATVSACSAAMRKNVLHSVGQQPKPIIRRLTVDVSVSHEIRHTHPVGTNITWLEINRARRLELTQNNAQFSACHTAYICNLHLLISCGIIIIIIIIIISIQHLGRFSRNQNPFRRPVWCWPTAS